VRKKIGECLVQAGLITEDGLKLALAEHRRTGERVGVVLVRRKLATEKQIANALALQLGFQYVNLAEHPPDPSAVIVISEEMSLKHVCVAISLEQNLLTVAMSEPLLFSLVQDLELQTGYRIKQVVATRSGIIDAIQSGYPDKPRVRTSQASSDVSSNVSSALARGREGSDEQTGIATRSRENILEPIGGPKECSEAAPIVDLVDLLVRSAIKSKASDIHVEPMENGVLIRHRLDGLLKEVMDLPKWVHEGLIARLKIMAGMDVAEQRLPQEGRLRATSEEGGGVDFRVSTLRTLFGEKVVMRLLDHRKDVPALDEIGMSATALEELRNFLRHQHGMILVVGPTGSGKSTTLGAALKAVQSEKMNIITIEDPIEYRIPGVSQTQINETITLTFASALRSILRQDPDVILVGEIRDGETANIAMQAQTGHLVFSTLHTDDAASVVTRLMDLGIKPSAIASALIGVVAQRLVRRLCVHCRRLYTPSAETLRLMYISEAEGSALRFYKAVGCDQCNHTGFRGRVGIYEVMTITDKLRRLITARASEDQIRDAAITSGMSSLGEDGLAKVKSGVTTPEELLRVVTAVREVRTLCSGCGAVVGIDFIACAHCGVRLNSSCPHCGRSMQPGWNYCPYCAQRTEMEDPRRRLRHRNPRAGRSELPVADAAEVKK
jgi:type IV pilus assembly protein PilB